MGCGCGTPCTGTPDCTCPVKDLSTDCSTYTGDDLVNSGITKNTILTKVITDLDTYINNKFNEALNYLSLINIGAGAKVFKGISGIGNKEIRTIEQGDDILVTEETDTIKISNPSATEAIKGVAEIATQAETDAGTDDERYITPLKLNAFVDDPTNLPNATEIQRGVIELATQVETNTGTDTERAITPATLNGRVATETLSGILEVATQAEADALSVDDKIITPGKIPISSETQQGVVELATQAEADAGVDAVKAITPATMAVYVAAPTNLPDATESQKGIIEIATAAEANALSLDDKVVTPAKLPIASETQQGLIEIATQAEVDAGTDTTRAVTSATLNTVVNAIPGLTQLAFGTALMGDINGGTSGSVTVTGDILTATKTNPGSSNVTVAVTFATVGTSTYRVLIEAIDLGGASSDIKGILISNKSATGFTIETSEESAGVQDIRFDITLID